MTAPDRDTKWQRIVHDAAAQNIAPWEAAAVYVLMNEGREHTTATPAQLDAYHKAVRDGTVLRHIINGCLEPDNTEDDWPS
ncbi:MAG UNVERIFIED_CONTAM: hypothetical protein LOD86_04760 [Thermobifida fusca]